jgi:hypothetical protein
VARESHEARATLVVRPASPAPAMILCQPSYGLPVDLQTFLPSHIGALTTTAAL